MANEKRLIDANASICKKCEHYLVCKFADNETEECSQYKDPTVDAVEVVRCKDCEHCKKYINRFDPTQKERMLCKRIYDFAFGVEADDFCSYGERREGE